MADTQKKLDLDPTFLREETERGKKFWNKTLVEMKFSVEKEWIAEVRKLPEQKKPNYGMGNMDPVLEELTGNKLELVGPMLDSYLREIGQSMCNKLTRSKATGLMSPISLFIPYAMFKHLWVLAVGYQGDMSVDNKGNITLLISRRKTATSIWSVARFSGQNFMSKRLFDKVPVDGRKTFVFNGRADVVVSKNTPIKISYNIKQERAYVTFYVQRYDRGDFAKDAALQKLLNKD